MRANPPVSTANRRQQPDSPASDPPEYSVPRPTTGTADDDDEPEDERADENTEAPEEFEVDDEDDEEDEEDE